MSLDQNKQIAQQLMERLDQRDIDGVLSYCTSDARWYGFAPQALNNEGYRYAIGAILSGYPDSHFPVSQWVAEGDTIVAVHTLQGTQDGEIFGVPPTGKRVIVNAAVTFKIVAGKVVETRLFADLLGMMQQLGAIPMPNQSGL